MKRSVLIFTYFASIRIDKDIETQGLPWVRFEDPDCWMVYLAAGELQDLLALIPHKLQFICWERDNRLRFWDFETFRTRVANRDSKQI